MVSPQLKWLSCYDCQKLKELNHCLASLCACMLSRSVVSSSLWHRGLWPTRLLYPWYFPGQNTGLGCHFLLRGIFQAQGLNLLFSLFLPNCNLLEVTEVTQYASKFGKLSSDQQDWKRSVFIPIPKKDNAKECSNYHTIALISHASKVMLKILQVRLQQQVNHELPDVQAGFRKGRGTRDQIANIRWIIEKAREFQKNIYFCFIDYAKAFDCVDHSELWKILTKMGIPDHLTCLLRNLYAGQEATVRTGHGTTDWFQIGKGVRQGYIWSPCLFNLYAEYTMRNAGLEEAQAGIKIARRNINNLRYADDTNLMAESEEELKSLLIKVKA